MFPTSPFPCAAIVDAETGRIAIIMAERIRWSVWPSDLSDILDFVKANSLKNPA
jgi:hypothetical protein